MSEQTNSDNNHKITKDDVVAKLKDDGDFDRLRLNIIRKLKDDEELRENLKSIVRQSAAINRSGAENLKPRQLSDAIYQEVGDKLMGQISDGLWGIIRSNDGIKSEIVETVKSVYNRLTGSKGISSDAPVQAAMANGSDHMLSDGCVSVEPPGFSPAHNHLKRKIEDLPQPSILADKQKKQSGDCSDDEELDVPPGFG